MHSDDLSTNYIDVSDRVKSGRVGARRKSHLDDPATVAFLRARGIIDDDRAAHNMREMKRKAEATGVSSTAVFAAQEYGIRLKAGVLRFQTHTDNLMRELEGVTARWLAGIAAREAKARADARAKAEAPMTFLRDTRAELARLARELGM